MKKFIIIGGLFFIISCTSSDQFGKIHRVGPLPPVTIKVKCPSGYVGVPALTGYSSSDFCVGEYEAQIINGKAAEVAAVVGTTVRKRSDAVAACSALGAEYSLITNDQWEAVARNIYSVAKNWSTGAKEGGDLSFGHSDADPDQAIATGSNDTNGCINNANTDCIPGSWHYQGRTQYLSTGKVIWDFSGNLPEWVSDNPDVDLTSLGSGSAVLDITDQNVLTSYGPKFQNVSSIDSSTLEGGLGYITVNSDLGGGIPMGVIRGGGFESLQDSGIFNAEINVPAETDTYDFDSRYIGFRCVYQP